MSTFVRTKVGVVMRVQGNHGLRGLLLACPGCSEWIPLSDDQAHGRVSVDHAADGCVGGYHETHDFSAAVGGADWRESDWEYGSREDADAAALAYIMQVAP